MACDLNLAERIRSELAGVPFVENINAGVEFALTLPPK